MLQSEPVKTTLALDDGFPVFVVSPGANPATLEMVQEALDEADDFAARLPPGSAGAPPASSR